MYPSYILFGNVCFSKNQFNKTMFRFLYLLFAKKIASNLLSSSSYSNPICFITFSLSFPSMIFYQFVTDIFYNTVLHSLPFSIVFCHLFIMLYHVPSSKCSIMFLVSSCMYTWNMSFVAIVFQTYWTSQDQNVPKQRFSYSTCWQSITGVLCCFLFFKPLDQKTLDTKLNNLTPLNHVRQQEGKRDGVNRLWESRLTALSPQSTFLCRWFCFSMRCSTIF